MYFPVFVRPASLVTKTSHLDLIFIIHECINSVKTSGKVVERSNCTGNHVFRKEVFLFYVLLASKKQLCMHNVI